MIIISIGLTGIAFADDAVEGSGTDICYSDPYAEGTMCMGFGGVNCTNYIPIVNSSGEDLSDITVYLSSDGIMNGSLNEACGVVDDEGTCENYSENQVAGEITIAGYSYGYDLNDMSADDDINTYIESTVSINFNNNELYTTYTKDGVDYYSEIYPCDAAGSSSYVTGPFDAWDTDSDIAERVIKTEVVSSDFSLIINSLNADDDDTEIKPGIDVEYRLYDLDTDTNVTAWESYDASADEDGESEVKSFTGITKAYKDVRVQFKLCLQTTTSWSGSTTTELKPLSDCDEDEMDTSTFSTDNFAIRPYALAAFGENQYKRAGEDFNITIKALSEDDTVKLGDSSYASDSKDTLAGIVGYQANLSDLSIVAQYYVPSSAEIDQMQTDTGATDVATCSNSGVFSIVNTTDTFTDGEVEASLNFTETGILDINVSESATHEWALVDIDDTNDSRRYIQPSTITYQNEDISANILMLFVPYKLDTTVTYDNTATGQEWLYINDINQSNSTFTTPDHAVYVTYTIVAKNKNGDTTKNYTKTCFPDVDEVNCPRVNGLKLNTTFDLFLDSSINISKDANISLYTEDNNSVAVWTPLKNLTLVEGNNSIREWISPFEFTDGVGAAKVYFNIDRNISQSVNPVVITLKDANTSTSWMANSGSPKEFNGNTVDSNKTFYYGRTHASRQRFSQNDAAALIYYEVYCSGSGCDRSLLQNSDNLRTVDDPRWFINLSHDATLDGAVGAVAQKVNTGSVTTGTATQANPASVDISYVDSATKGYPYQTTMENQASTWLIYNKYNENDTTNEFDVEFVNPNANWAGIHETNTTTKTDATEKTNRRTMW
jgi:hypothetical protein